MEPRRPPQPHSTHLREVAYGFLMLVLRVGLIFAVIGLGYSVFELFGKAWFHVFVFAVIAFRLHWELRLIERTEFPAGEDGEEAGGKTSNPFRKR